MSADPELAVAPWLLALASVTAVSLLSLLGALVFVLRRDRLQQVLPYLVSLAVGAMLGSAFLHLIPEVSHHGLGKATALQVLAGIALFFAFERFIHWHHHGHSSHAVVAPWAWLTLAGDGLHNFVDGIIIAVAWLQSPHLGLATTLAVALHEIPQELGDMVVLVHARLSRLRAVLLNLGSGLLSILGAGLAIAFHGTVMSLRDPILAMTAGGFIYIAAADLMPELHRERRMPASIVQLLCLVAGIALMATLPHPEH